jgi:hypothetical protein
MQPPLISDQRTHIADPEVDIAGVGREFGPDGQG